MYNDSVQSIVAQTKLEEGEENPDNSSETLCVVFCVSGTRRGSSGRAYIIGAT